ncbi:hypothetical protein GCM10008018_03720 [Paenibacillus marchantiophytorum]|uniref:Uncharacterized protein n=1 Tax=Paenibacillus marchantiophytorum TaxID=1619310 RepID=A0ABQ2BR68_9BACL|nr:hypothetical protein GCM10008018_03720 [Paenibacillus marchantiophytorum]
MSSLGAPDTNSIEFTSHLAERRRGLREPKKSRDPGKATLTNCKRAKWENSELTDLTNCKHVKREKMTSQFL